MELESDTASWEELAMESVLDTVLLEELAMGLLATVLSVTVSATALLEESAMESLEELASALEECTTATPDTTEPPSSTLLSLVRMLVANASFCKRDISILSIEMNI